MVTHLSGNITNIQTISGANDIVLGTSLTIDGALENDGTLTNYGTLTNNRTLFNDGALNNDGTLTNGGYLSNYGTLNNNGTLDNYDFLFNKGSLINYSTLTNNGILDNGDTLTNNRTLNNNGTFNNNYGKIFINNGTFTNNDGKIFINNGTFTNNGSYTDIGIHAGSGTWVGNYTKSGGILAPGGTLTDEDEDDVYVDTNGTYTINGNFSLTGGTLSLSVAGVDAGDFDTLNVKNGASLSGGTIQFSLDENAILSDLTPGIPKTISLLTASGLTNSLNLANLTPADTNQLDYTLLQQGNNLVLQIQRLNTAPTNLTINTTSVNENVAANTIVGTFSTTDAEGGNFTYELVSGDGSTDNSAFTIINGNQLRINTSPNYEAKSSYNIRVKTTDAGGLSFSKALTIGVNDINEAPTAIALSANTVAENAAGAVIGILAVTDPDTNPAFGNNTLSVDDSRFEVVNGQLKLKQGVSLNYEALTNGQLNLTVTATDASNSTLTKSQLFVLNVTDVNEAPTITSASTATLPENSTGVAYTASASDPDANTTLTYSLAQTLDGSLFNINQTTGAVSFKNAPNFEAPTDSDGNNIYQFTVIASDGSLSSAKDVDLSVTNVNEAPTITSASTATLAENSTGVAYTASATDPDANTTLTYSLAQTLDGSLFNINQTTGAVSFKNAPNFEIPTDSDGNNIYQFTVIASDGSLSSALDVALTVTDVNEAPTITSASTANFEENSTGVAYTATATDPDANTTLTYSLAQTLDGSLFNINQTTGAVSFKNAPNFEIPTDSDGNNIYQFTVIASDGSLSSAKDVDLSVTNVNEAPTATGETVSTSKNTGNPVTNITVELGDNLTDPDINGLANATLKVTSTTNGTIYNINQDAQLITFTPTAGFSGTASFKYTVTDAGGLTSNEATVIVEVGDILTTGNKDQDIQGNNGNDYISSGNGKDRIQGFGGNDTLLGNNGADTIDGGSGDDLIDGGNGPDWLTGGTGRDKFVLAANAGGDTITDFSLTEDWFKLGSGLTFGTGNSTTDIKQSLSGSDLLLSSANNTLLATLQNVSSFLTSSNFTS